MPTGNSNPTRTLAELEQRRQAKQEYNARQRRETPNGSIYKKIVIINRLGGICISNGCEVLGRCSDINYLVLDHIHGGGNREIESFGHRDRFLDFYYESPELAKQRLQVLCANCNAIKKIVNNECGERTRKVREFFLTAIAFEKYCTQMDKGIIRRRKPRLDVIKILGNRCVSDTCPVIGGSVNPLSFHVDHIYGGGNREIKEFGNDYQMYIHYREHPEEAKRKLQILCACCNMKKRADNHEHGTVAGRSQLQSLLVSQPAVSYITATTTVPLLRQSTMLDYITIDDQLPPFTAASV